MFDADTQAQLPLFADIYRQMDLVIGMRGHSNIVPFGLGTPVVGLGSHNKNRFFLAQIGAEKAMINTQTFPQGCSAEEMFALVAKSGPAARMSASATGWSGARRRPFRPACR